jgi:GMP synthase (glutamine-hydrolysing)
MTRYPAIIKLGSTMPELATRRGDFEDWILNGMKLTRDDVRIVDPTQDHALPTPDTLSSVVITGSHAMVTERAPWSERTAAWLRDVVEARVPLLGICYGHQLLARAFGGEVENNPLGREFGTVVARLTAPARHDRLFGALDEPLSVHTSHTQTVRRLPPQARVLASSEQDPNLAFAIGDCAWGVQFHPEFDAEITRAYIHAYAPSLLAEGQQPERLLATCRESPHGSALLRRFAALADGRDAPCEEAQR